MPHSVRVSAPGSAARCAIVAIGGRPSIYRETTPRVSNFWTRTISRWINIGAVGLGVFGVSFVLQFWRDEDSGDALWFCGLMATLSLIALGIGLFRTRRVRSTDSGSA